MKKKNLILVIVLILALTFVLTACSTFDEDITVVLDNQGVIQETHTISIFRNCIINAVPAGAIPSEKDFLGWAAEKDSTDIIYGYSATSLVRYADVQHAIKNNIVVLYAVFGEKEVVKHDLVIGWYARSATSGVTESIMNAYRTALVEYLATQGYSNLDIDIRGYDGDVAGSCADILAAGDVEILIGWGGNLTSLGGITTIERTDNIIMSGKARNIALIAETTLSRLIFVWSTTNATALAIYNV